MQHPPRDGDGSWKKASAVPDRRLDQRPSGVIGLDAGRRWFDVAQFAPASELGDLVEHYWRVRWDLGDHEPYTQHTLSNASVHLVFERGQSRVQGIVTGRFTRVLEGRGRVFGVKFRPAGFRPFRGAPVADLADRSVAVADVFGPAGEALVERVLALEEDDRVVDACDTFLRDRRPPPDPVVATLNAIVARVVEDRSVTRVDHLVSGTGIGKRRLQRLFSEYVGVSPKWVIARYRLHEAELRLATGQDVDLAALALDLGYYDQAHFARDFRAIVGRPPAAYGRSASGPG
jgi:AraC-like DNA-binding protein